MLIAIDNGYSHTKALSLDGRRAIFPSVVGEVQQMHQDLSNQDGYIQVELDNGKWFVGNAAIEQSRQQTRRQDRDWIKTPEYKALVLAAITELTSGTNVSVDVVTGLPVDYFNDRQELISQLRGSHSVDRPERNAQRVTISEVVCLPQGLAAVFSEALDERGNIKQGIFADGEIGLLDVGGHTVNVATFKELRAISKQTASIPAGMWGVLSEIGKRVNAAYPGLDLSGHELIDVVKTGTIKRYGKKHDVSGIIQDTLRPFARRILAEASQAWGSTARLDVLLVAGGGANVVGPTITSEYPHAQIVKNPQWANTIGYLKFGRRHWRI
jgi:plasmid segregation protein ParM